MTLTQEQQEFAKKELAFIRRGGRSDHEVWVADCVFGLGSSNLAPVNPAAVGVCGDDHFYAQYFNTRDELESFITKLRVAADKAWGAAA